jgi:hypothetical protein
MQKTHKIKVNREIAVFCISMRVRGVRAQRDPCTATTSWSIVHSHLLYSTAVSYCSTVCCIAESHHNA